MSELLKLPEVAQRLDVSEKTARRYVKSGRLPSVFIGGAYRVSREDLEKYLEGSRVGPSGERPKVTGPSLPEEERRAAFTIANARIELLESHASLWDVLLARDQLDLEAARQAKDAAFAMAMNHSMDRDEVRSWCTPEELPQLEAAEERFKDVHEKLWDTFETAARKDAEKRGGVADLRRIRAEREERMRQVKGAAG